MIKKRRILIVGAGVAGLTAGERLASQGAEVILAEREHEVGGLARSFRYDGMTFDIGPHRFQTDDPEVEQYIKNALGPDCRVIDRSSAVWLYNNYHEWPLTRSSLLKLPPNVMAQAFVDLFRRPKPKNDSLEDYILARYGRTLYEIFFKPYTEKFLTYKCRELHQDWASAGINRAVIDKRLRFDNLFRVALNTLLPPPVRTLFLYPESGGIDKFSLSLAQKIEAKGGKIFTDAPVTGLDFSNGQVQSAELKGHGKVEFDTMIWTAPLPLLKKLLGLEQTEPNLKYLTELNYNFVIDGPPVLPYQWTYYGGAALSFMRSSIPSHFNPRNADSGVSGICLEVVCQEGDELWDNPELLRRSIEHDLVKVGLIRQRSDVRSMHVEKITEVYPIYTLDYPGKLQRSIEGISQAKNVMLLGRTGTFWYNNMDHSIRQGLDLAKDYRSGIDAVFWNEKLQATRSL